MQHPCRCKYVSHSDRLVAAIVNAINNTKNAQKELEENKRHNQSMEAIAIGSKTGKGFYLHPNKGGRGFYLAPYTKNQ